MIQKTAIIRYAYLYLGVLTVGILTSSGRIGVSDSASMFKVAESIVHRRTFEATPCETTATSNHCVPGKDGKFYAGFGLLPSIIVAPSIVIGEGFASGSHRPTTLLSEFLVSLDTVFVGAFIPVLAALYLQGLGFSYKSSALTGLLLFFGSVVWHDSVKGFYSEPFLAVALLSSVYLLSIGSEYWHIVLAGFLFGCGSACRVFALTYLPIFVLYSGLVVRPGASLTRSKQTLSFCVGVLLPVSAVGWANYLRFGDPMKTGYQNAFPTIGRLLSNPTFVGLHEIFFDGDVGLIWFTPWLLAVPLAWARFYRSRPLEFALSFSIILESILFFASYASWHGGWAYGPRLLMPTLTFAALPIVTLIERWRDNNLAVRISFFVLALASVVINLGGMPYPLARYYQLGNYYRLSNRPVPWHGSLFIAQWLDLGNLSWTQKQPAIGVPSGSTNSQIQSLIAVPDAGGRAYLESFSNSVNLTTPDFWILKATRMGLPLGVAAAIAIALFGTGICLTYLALNESKSRKATLVVCKKSQPRPPTKRQ